MSLSQETIEALLRAELQPIRKSYPKRSAAGTKQLTPGEARLAETRRNERRGPVRWYDKPMKCLHESGFSSKGCRTETFLRVEGKPVCMVHAISILNDTIIKMQEEKETFTFTPSIGTQGVEATDDAIL